MRARPVLVLLSLLVSSHATAQDFMKIMKPYEESLQDSAVLAQVAEIDKALSAQDRAAYDRELTKLRDMKPKKNLESTLRSQKGVNRALAVMGMRVLPAKREWDDLRYMLMDSTPMVRRQVLLYASEQPQGISLEAVQMSLQDGSPEVRSAAVLAIVNVAKKKEQAAEVLRSRLRTETDATVIAKIRLGFTLMGMSSQP
jgi:HEAT repeat protein